MVGMDRRSEKRAASVRSKPSMRAAVMVMPLRLVPGMRARAWAKPMNAALPSVMCSMRRTVMPSRSAA